MMETCPPPSELDSITPYLETRPERSLFKGKWTGDILLVEDYAPNQEVARLHLESAGHKVTVAGNGKEAVKACEDKKYDVILMDLQMPEMDGFEASIRIRFNKTQNADIPILAMTANADADIRKSCREALMTDVLTKPIRRVSLLAAVERWLISIKEGMVPGPVSLTKSPPTQEAKEPEPMPVANSDTVPLDYEVALDEFGSVDILGNVVMHFVQNVEKQIEIMKESLLTKDRDRLRREVHSIKGGASTLEAGPLTEISGQLEAIFKHGSLDEAQPVLEAFFAEFNRFRKYVTDDLRLVR
jgi:CheY-like chemotaxis protein/HPt (histidine-containing phosphotransfer) domain-containing protein